MKVPFYFEQQYDEVEGANEIVIDFVDVGTSAAREEVNTYAEEVLLNLWGSQYYRMLQGSCIR